MFSSRMTLSTLKSIFSGEKELFKGLYIYDKDYDWKKYPIIHLALNSMGSSDAEELEENLALSMKKIARQHNIVLETKRSYQRFQELIEELSLNGDKVEELEKLEVKSGTFSSYEIDKPRVEPLLFQTGYLNIKNIILIQNYIL